MDRMLVQGGSVLKGEVSISGSKNAALPLIFSTLLSPGCHRLTNVPELRDVFSAIEIMESLGCRCDFQKNELNIEVGERLKVLAHYDQVRKMRASILVLGPLLARFGQARVSLPGGCAIGARPIGMHIEALKKMGARIRVDKGYVVAEASKLAGASVELPFPTVGGTENIMMAASLAQGTTFIHNAAREPEIKDLADYLIRMGASIQGAGTSSIEIRGQRALHPGEHRVIADRVEAGTFVVAAAITKGEVILKNCNPNHLRSFLEGIRSIGVHCQESGDQIYVKGGLLSNPLHISTGPYPGFSTDLQAQLMSLLTQVPGESSIMERVFENRFMHISELMRLGAQIQVNGQKAVIQGGTALVGAPLMATDLRASACLILAGLVARGQTVIHRIYHLDRGYEKLEKKLSNLGAKIQRVKEVPGDFYE